jgi:general secretion pathway protein D
VSFRSIIIFPLLIGSIFLFTPHIFAADNSVQVLDLQGESTDGILTMIEKLSGKPVIRKVDLPQREITFNSIKPLTNDEALAILESLLSINGIMLTDVGDNYLKALKTDVANSEVPRLLTSDVMKMEPSEKVYSLLVKLKFLEINEAETLLKPFLTNETGQKAVQKFASTNTIMLTDAVINLQRIRQILDKIDQPIELREEMIFHKVNSVSAVELQKSLVDLQKNSLKKYLEGNTTIDADERTNQLIIFTPPGNVEFIKQIISKLDVVVAPLTQSAVISVSNAEAKEVVAIIKEIITGQEQEIKKSKSNSKQKKSNNNQKKDTTTNTETPPPPTTPTNAAGSEDTRNLQFSEYIQIVADERSNSIIVYGTKTDITQIEDLVKNVDILLAQVRIDVVVCEVTLSNAETQGIDSFGIDVNTEGVNEINLNNLKGPGAGSLGTAFSVSGSLRDFKLKTVFDKAKQNSNINIISTPNIVTTHNKEASIVVGEERPFITGSTSSINSGGSTSSSISRENVGIELKVKPLIGANGVVQMEIEQKIEKVISTTQIDGNEQPIVGTREAKSYVSVGDGEVFVLGGLRELETSDGKGKMFFFGSIPIIGKLFQSESHSKRVSELLIFIQPTIIRQPTDGTPMLRRDLDSFPNGEKSIDQLKDWHIDTDGKKKPVEKMLPDSN